MPLHYRSTWNVLPRPKMVDKNEEFFVMRFTNEIFQNYEDYIERLELYRSRVWTCEATNRGGFTYEEALESEAYEAERVKEFPLMFAGPTLRLTQFNTANIDGVGAQAYRLFREECLIGETVTKTGSKKRGVVAAVMKQNGNENFITYEIRMPDGQIALWPMDKVRRPYIPNRHQVKVFIRSATTRDSYPNAPWIVNNDWATKLGLSKDMPPELLAEQRERAIKLQRANEEKAEKARKQLQQQQDMKGNHSLKRQWEHGQNTKMSDKDKAQQAAAAAKAKVAEELKKIRYPIEDKEVKHERGAPKFPKPKEEFLVDAELYPMLLAAWSFFQSFGETLGINSFPLEMFIDALKQTPRDNDALPILDDVIANLLHVIWKDKLASERGGDDNDGSKAERILFDELTKCNWQEALRAWLFKDVIKVSIIVKIPSFVKRVANGDTDFVDLALNERLWIIQELCNSANGSAEIRKSIEAAADVYKSITMEYREARAQHRKLRRLRDAADKENAQQESNEDEDGDDGSQDNTSDATSTVEEEISEEDRKRQIIVARMPEAPDHTTREGRREFIKWQNLYREVEARVNKEEYDKEKREKAEASAEARAKALEVKKRKQEEEQQCKKEERLLQEATLEKEKIRMPPLLGQDREHHRFYSFQGIKHRLFVVSPNMKKWAYYDTPDELEMLYAYLSPKGVRELNLRKNLERDWTSMHAIFKKKSRELMEGNRRSSRVKDKDSSNFTSYTNTISRLAKPSSKKKKTKTAKASPDYSRQNR